jgi:hypothetical protein
MNKCNIETVVIQSVVGPTGAQGVPGQNGACVIHNEFTESDILTAGSWQNFSADKTFSIPLNLLSVGDRLKIEVTGSVQIESIHNKSVGIRILVDTNPVTTARAALPHTYIGYGKFYTTIDVVGATGTALNLKTYTRYEYTFSDPKICMRPAEFNIEEKFITVDYATTPSKNIELQGVIDGSVVDATNYIKVNQFCVEYFKKQ